jgi:ribonuclease P protein component
MDERLRPFERLRCSVEFDRVFQRGRRFYTPVLRIHWRRNGRQFSRLGLVVTKRLGKAVRRNAIKRALREVFRRLKSRIAAPTDIVFVPQAPEAALEAYREAFLVFLGKIERVPREAPR